MNFFPFEKYIYNTHLNGEEVLKRLNKIIVPKNQKNIINSTETFQGEFDGKSFKMSRVINYRNSFLPEIIGEMQERNNNVEIFVQLQLPKHIKKLVTLISGIHFIVFLLFIKLGVFPWGFLLSFIFLILILHIGFKKESKLTKEFLENLFETKLI